MPPKASSQNNDTTLEALKLKDQNAQKELKALRKANRDLKKENHDLRAANHNPITTNSNPATENETTNKRLKDLEHANKELKKANKDLRNSNTAIALENKPLIKRILDLETQSSKDKSIIERNEEITAKMTEDLVLLCEQLNALKKRSDRFANRKIIKGEIEVLENLIRARESELNML